jgi:2-iminobutanoate/2-iminopropanoate deaminase
VGDDSAKGVTEQSAFAFSSLRELMTQAGGTIDDVALLTIMVKDYADQPAIMAEWRRMFPDESSQPARHTMALGAPGNNLVQLHVVATVPA